MAAVATAVVIPAEVVMVEAEIDFAPSKSST